MNVIKSLILIMLMFSFGPIAEGAKRREKCFDLIYNEYGMWQKYDYAYLNGAGSTDTTDRQGFVDTSMEHSLQSTVAAGDPGVWFGATLSHAQSTSFWGPCSLLAGQPRQLQREIFIARHLDEIKGEAARGRGSFLDLLAWYSGCPAKAGPVFARTIQASYPRLMEAWRQKQLLGQEVDQLIRGSQALTMHCTDKKESALPEKGG